MMLDEFDALYWSEKLKTLQTSGEELTRAQSAYNEAQTALQGFAIYIKDKYKIPDDAVIAPDGTITTKDKEQETNT